MRSSPARPAAAAALLLLCAAFATAFASDRASTDAFEVDAPGKPWKRAPALDPPGRLTWDVAEVKATQGELRVSFEGAPGASAPAAIARILELEKARIREGSNRNSSIERSAFVADSMTVGALKWVGFHVDIKAGPRSASVSRWVALHPDFPGRRRAFLVAFDEETPPGVRPTPRGRDVQALLHSLVPVGAGLKGGLETAYLDARTAAFAAHLDTTTRLCWRNRGPDAAPSRAWLGLGPGIALEGDFYQLSDVVPKDSVLDAASTEYGAAFDRNGDGRVDLLVMNRGIASARGATVLPIAAALADDDFDGRIDGLVIENGDADGDGRADHRLFVSDRDHDGKPDHALRFEDAIGAKKLRDVTIRDGIVSDRVVGSPVQLLDFSSTWREAGALMAELDRARAACAH
jgi:hypothetical protein